MDKVEQWMDIPHYEGLYQISAYKLKQSDDYIVKEIVGECH